MPGASTTGADAGGGTTRHREHNQGNQDRKATPEQIAAVVRIRRCNITAYYDILDLEAVRTTCTETDIKKAYRKQSLLTHPDKNGHEHADEAFKMVAKAFSVLGDKDKRARFDKFGGDPESRFGAGAGAGPAGGNPFAGFARRPGGAAPGFAGGGAWDEELTPEEIFNRFFGGGGAFGGPFGGPQFVFNMGGGPGFRVHQFGGPRPRMRPRNPGQPEPESPLRDMIIQLLPLFILILLPIFTNLFSAIVDPQPSQPSMPKTPKMVFEEADPEAGFTEHRTMPNLNIDYYVREKDVATMTNKKLYEMDKYAEIMFMRQLKDDCAEEQAHKKKLAEEAQGWFFQDPEKMDLAVRYETPSCARYENHARALIGS